MNIIKVYLAFLFSVLTFSLHAQNKVVAIVLEQGSKTAITGASVSFKGSKKNIAYTDVNGRFIIENYNNQDVSISYIGFKTLHTKLKNNSILYLFPNVSELGEVVVTAQENKGLRSASIIKRHAMEHLQPSSFSDLLELLPGGRARDPQLNSPNQIRLREATPYSSSNYNTSSLGTSFVIDGAPMSSNANIQTMKGSWEAITSSRDATNAGVDMRTISTDDIDRVEIVRGIPSVEYGDLTSGLVSIERKRGGHYLDARLKADMSSKLFYLSKAFEWNNKWTLNISGDFLNSKADPRNSMENYKRITLSARTGRRWNTSKYYNDLKINLDYGASLDGEKKDPELNFGQEDSYKSNFNRFALNSSFSIKPHKPFWWDGLNATFSTSYEQNEIKRTRFIQLQQTTPVVFAMQNGESDAYILPYKYVATQKVDGKPISVYAKINSSWSVPSKLLKNKLLVGGDWHFDKNYGRGQLFDAMRPLYPQTSIRNRPFKNIPSNNLLAFYLEENTNINVGKNVFEVIGGARFSKLLGVDDTYNIAKHIYSDLRLNAGWTFPKFKIKNKNAIARLAFGVGSHTKFPTIEQLYPDNGYLDITQLNYYNTNEEYRRVNVITYVIDRRNKTLTPARNVKFEVSADLSFDNNRFSITIFRENMSSGFRTSPFFLPYSYKEYDTSSINPSELTAPPSLGNLPYSVKSELFSHEQTTNGSRTLKRGIEYTFSTKRFESIHSRITINGAWFKTTYQNSLSIMVRPQAVLNNRQLNVVGIYKDNDKLTTEMANTNFTFDTDVPNLKLGFSVSAQCLWFTSSKRDPLSNIPSEYMNGNGVINKWQMGDENDSNLRWLVRNYNESFYKKETIPFSVNLNFKVTKKIFKDRLTVAMFCNKLLDYTPNYKDGDVIIRRHVSPYFGLETNVRL